jgi:hypothetical protein
MDDAVIGGAFHRAVVIRAFLLVAMRATVDQRIADKRD